MARINTLDLSIGTRLGKLESGLKTAGTRIKTWSSGVSKIASGVFIGNAIGAGVGKALGGLKSALSTGFDVSIESEQALISLESLTQSSTVAKKVFGDLKSFASSTPFQINDLSNVTNKLLGFGVESENVIDTVKRLGNVSAGLNVPLESVALTFGKIKTLGIAQNGELLQFAEKGIPIYSELAKQLGVSESQVKTLASQSKISFENVDAAFTSLTSSGAQFDGVLEKQSNSLGGLLSTLGDSWSLMLGEISTGLIQTFDIKGLIKKAIGFINGLVPPILNFFKYIKSFRPQFQIAVAVFKNIGKVWDLTTTNMALSGVRFFNRVIYFFTEALPYSVSFWARNGFEIIKNLFSNLMQLGTNYFEALITNFMNLPKLLTGQMSIGDILTDTAKTLTKGMKDLVEEEFILPERSIGIMEQTLTDDVARLQTDLQNSIAESIKEQEIEYQASLPDPEVIKPVVKDPVTTPEQPEQSETRFASLAEQGSQQARQVLLAALGRGKNETAKDQLDVAEQQLEVQKQQLNEAKKQQTSSSGITLNVVEIVG